MDTRQILYPNIEIPKRFLEIESVFRQGASAGLNGTLDHSQGSHLPTEFRGVIYEGLSMGLTARYLKEPSTKNIWTELLVPPGNRHSVLIHVGKGMALAQFRIPWPARQAELQASDPFMECFMLDGYGFYFGYYLGETYIAKQSTQDYRPDNFFQGRIFDQGLGRSLWFHAGANLTLAGEIARSYKAERRPDLWTGIGLACTFAGGGINTEVQKLIAADCEYLSNFATGAAIAAWIRGSSGSPAAHTQETWSSIAKNKDAESIVERALHSIPEDANTYLHWHELIQKELDNK